MTALTQDQVVYVRRQVGSRPDDAALQTIFDRLEPTHGNSPAVEHLVLEVLETRYADLLANPAQFSVSGEYSQNTAANIEALAKKIAAWKAWMASLGLEVVSAGVLTFTAPVLRNWR